MKTKIGIIGAGHVGSHVASSLVTQGLCDEIVLLDLEKEKAHRSAQDIADSLAYMPLPVTINAGEYCDLADADIVVISACGTYFESDRLLELQDTAAQIKAIAPQLVQSGFAGIVLSISNPCDVIAQYIAQLTNFNVIGTGTALDSARLQKNVADQLNVSLHSVNVYAMGEHGDSQIAAFHAATVAGQPLLPLLSQQQLSKAHQDTVTAGWDIVQGKGCTEFGIGAACARLIKAIVHDEKAVLPCSTLLQGEYGQSGVYASVPCIVGAGGVEKTIEIPLSETEKAAFIKSCQILHEHVKKVGDA